MSEEVKEEQQNEETPAVEQSNELSLSTVFGFKKGMSAIFNDKGERLTVTVLECKPWVVTQLKTQEKDGYQAVQLSYGAKKSKNSSKSENGHVKAAGAATGFQYSREVRGEVPEGCELGKMATISGVEAGQKVQVTAVSKGRGFSGVMKRHGFGGGPASHGSGFHRRPGSIGNCTFPGRVMPGRKMPGQYGSKNTTVRGIEVVGVNTDENVVLLKGSVPGPVNGLVKVSIKG